MRLGFRSVAVVNVLVALWLTTMFVMLRHPGYERNAAMALAIAAVCGFAFWAGRSAAAPWMRATALAGSIALAACGGWAIYEDLRPDANFEGFILIVGALWIVQGALAVLTHGTRSTQITG